MKYINKTTNEALFAAQQLHAWRDAFHNESGQSFIEICSDVASTSERVWDLLKNYTGEDYSQDLLREALKSEQGDICCYCGCELIDLRTVIEHFLRKSGDKCARTYNYLNLLLSCDGNNFSKKHTIQEGETWETIATKYEMTVKELKNKNKQKVFRIKNNLTIIPPPRHCDAAKLSIDTPIINPTVLPDCWDRFPYKFDGSIDETKADDLAKATIEVLNLNAESLKRKRKAVWKDAKKAYSDDAEINQYLDEEDTTAVLKRTRELLASELNQTYHLCIVRRAYLMSWL